MSVRIQVDSGEQRYFVVKLKKLPADIELKRPVVGLESLLPFIFLLIFLFFIGVNMFSPLVLAAAGLGVIILVIVAGYVLSKRKGRKHRLHFDQTGVDVIEAGAFRDKKWRAEYQDYECVLLRERVAKSEGGQATYQIIELKHPDPKKTLPLFVKKTKSVPEKYWRDFADLFRLPALTE